VLLDIINNLEVTAQDIGVGISQVLPIIVLSLSTWDGILAIEQPELHIHPALQVAIGDLFIAEVIKQRADMETPTEIQYKDSPTVDLDELYRKNSNINDRKFFILETHSEHLLLRLLRRVRETPEDTHPEQLGSLSADMLAVYYLENKGSGTTIYHLPVDDDGDFTQEWPDGFFEERDDELMF
jgi:predicted ATPase